MTMFPGSGARIYYNEAGEPLGWDYPDYDDPDLDEYYADWPSTDDCDHDGNIHPTEHYCRTCGCGPVCPNCRTEDSITTEQAPGMAGWASPIVTTRCNACDHIIGTAEMPYRDGDEHL